MIVEAFNSAVVLVAKALPAGALFKSPIIDFRDSDHGAIQLVWRDINAVDGVALIHGSLLRDESTLDDNDVEDSDFTIAQAEGSHLYTYKKLSFRYAQLRWTPGTVSLGTIDIWAIGKRS